MAYQAWIQKKGETPDPGKHHPGWVRTMESPVTENSSGSVSSSVSYNINGSAGFFGPTATGGVGGGVTVGNSYSHTVKDFTFYNRSQDGVLYHVLEMTSCGNGNPYSKPTDLCNEWQSPFVGARLRSLPALATSNVPIVGQVVWMSEDAAALTDDDLEVHVTVRASYSVISASGDFFSVRSSQTHWDGSVQHYIFPLKDSAADV